jgi:hypothetical protein
VEAGAVAMPMRGYGLTVENVRKGTLALLEKNNA